MPSNASAEKYRDRLSRLAAEHDRVTGEILELAHELRPHVGDDAALADVYLDALQPLDPRRITQQDVTATGRVLQRPIPGADSLWRSLITRRRKRQLDFLPEKRLGLKKDVDQDFVRSLGFPTVTTLSHGKWSQISTPNHPAVLKPTESLESKGAYYLFGNRFFSIAESRWIENWSGLEESAQTQASEAFTSGTWEVQALVTRQEEPAPDLKFYCFYGEIGTVLEVHRFPKQQYMFFDRELRPTPFTNDRLPRAASLKSSVIHNGHLREDHLQRVRDLSRSIPAPFMRIDMLFSDDGPVFCEFCGAPGNIHTIFEEDDRRLGEMYARAENRLINDLLRGKGFDTYRTHPVSRELWADMDQGSSAQ